MYHLSILLKVAIEKNDPLFVNNFQSVLVHFIQ